MKKIFIIIITVIFIISLVLSISYIIRYNLQDEEQERIFEKLEQVIIEEQTNNKEQESEEITKIQKLYEENADFIGWLEIENTNIDYPVMQTGEERKDYYLYKNFYKEYSHMGTPYIAEFCNVKESDNLIIYGHHINSNKMFGELEKYKKKSFYEEHKKIKFNTIYENTEYEIIAVFKTIAHTGFEYYKFYNADTKQEFDTFIQKCKELSFYNIEETAEYGDKLITLSTCEYSNKNGRLVVVAKKITNVLGE